MKKIVVKKNIKTPPKNAGGVFSRGTRGNISSYPLNKLEVGDGFEVDIKLKNGVRCSIQHFQRWYPGVRFITIRNKDKTKLIVKRTA